MAHQSNDQEMRDLEKIEIKQQILTEKEIEESIKKLKIDNENTELDKEFSCSICFNFAHDPISCIHCDFKACLKCFDEYKYKSKNEECIQCGKD